jgi:two-component system nitrate/nitrite response regulator NarL
MASVLLCTDEPILAEGLVRFLAGAEDLDLISCCPGIDELPAQMELHKPNLLLMDLTTGITLGVLRGIHEASPHARIVLWVRSISSELALQAMSLGVQGILRKTLPTNTLLLCLTKVNQGELWFEKALTDSILSARHYSLTRREGQLVGLLSQGLKNKEIATALTISEGTVKVYLSRLFQKLGVKDRFELALYGLKNLSPGGGALEASSHGDGQESPRSFFVEPSRVQMPRQQERRIPNRFRL